MGHNENDGEGTSGVKKFEENHRQQELSSEHGGLFLENPSNSGFLDPMVQSPPDSPRENIQTPTVLTPQVPPVAMQSQVHELLQLDRHVEYVIHEKLTRVKIFWNHSANSTVAILGSWDNWSATELMQIAGDKFVWVKTLASGIYHYRFIVDGYLTYAPDFPWDCDDSGYPYNILDLQEFIPENLASSSRGESPPSPPSSYGNRYLNDDEFGKPPPELPPQLPSKISNEPSSSTHYSPGETASRPSHVEMNHLYIHRNATERYLALRSSHRFDQKYVTVILYKAL